MKQKILQVINKENINHLNSFSSLSTTLKPRYSLKIRFHAHQLSEKMCAERL
jgi:hypothetical protein